MGHQDATQSTSASGIHRSFGKKQWTAGKTGPAVSFDMLFGSAVNTQRHEVLLAGKILFGRKRLAFEVQQVGWGS